MCILKVQNNNKHHHKNVVDLKTMNFRFLRADYLIQTDQGVGSRRIENRDTCYTSLSSSSCLLPFSVPCYHYSQPLKFGGTNFVSDLCRSLLRVSSVKGGDKYRVE